MRIVFDVEATGAQRNKAHPWDLRNVACNLGMKNLDTGETKIWKLEYDDDPYGESLREIQEWLQQATTLVGFNIKYDLHWLARYRLIRNSSCRVFDCQLAYYILTSQQNPYPSLDGVAEFFGVEKKLDVVKLEYWDKGLDTNQVPYDVLSEYLEQDLIVTEQVYKAIMDRFYNHTSIEMQRLITVSMQDLIVLQDIEQNGLLLNLEKSLRKGDEIVTTIRNIDEWLKNIAGVDWFNPNSGDHLSAFLYGGAIKRTIKEEYEFTYKDGRTAIKTRNAEVPFVFKRLFKPLEGSELAKDGFYATNEPTLTSIANTVKGEHKKILEVILQRAKLEKRRGTYYHGYPKRIEEMGWTDNIMHSSFNQCVVTTGRLSSTKPNVQNIEDQVKEVFISRFL
jgi:DNA polymerase-1